MHFGLLGQQYPLLYRLASGIPGMGSRAWGCRSDPAPPLLASQRKLFVQGVQHRARSRSRCRPP